MSDFPAEADRALLTTYLDQPVDSLLMDSWLQHLCTRRSKKGNR